MLLKLFFGELGDPEAGRAQLADYRDARRAAARHLPGDRAHVRRRAEHRRAAPAAQPAARHRAHGGEPRLGRRDARRPGAQHEPGGAVRAWPALALAAVALAAGCGDDDAAPEAPADAPRAEATPAATGTPPPAAPRARAVRFRAADGAPVSGAVRRRGARRARGRAAARDPRRAGPVGAADRRAAGRGIRHARLQVARRRRSSTSGCPTPSARCAGCAGAATSTRSAWRSSGRASAPRRRCSRWRPARGGPPTPPSPSPRPTRRTSGPCRTTTAIARTTSCSSPTTARRRAPRGCWTARVRSEAMRSDGPGHGVALLAEAGVRDALVRWLDERVR